MMTTPTRKTINIDNILGKNCYIFSDLKLLNERASYGFFGNSWDVKSNKYSQKINYNNSFDISILNQVHGVEVKSCSEAGSDGDAIIVQPGESGGVLTADCTPVIVYSSSSNLGAVLHCGWKSAINGLVYKTMSRLYDLGFTLDDEAKVLIGPAAQLCCYEVTSEFVSKIGEAEMFSRINLEDNTALKSLIMQEDKFFASIPKLVERQFLGLGFKKKQIYRAKNCTICDTNFFSYRRQGEDAGRQLSFLSIK